MLSMLFFFFNDTATTEIYTLSLHDALPISVVALGVIAWNGALVAEIDIDLVPGDPACQRSEEHTSELQSQSNLVCRLLLEKKKTKLHSLYKYHSMHSHDVFNISLLFAFTT